ncbi:MAG: nitrilase-related carbon-nitrogen hydrolase [Thermomicrobiales bacterium]
MAAPAPYLAAAIQFEPVLGDVEGNLEALLRLCEEAAAGGAKLIVLPEMATTGYCWVDRAEVAPFVEPIPGPTTEVFQSFCARHGCWVVVGMAEVVEDSTVYYNSAALVGPDGVEGIYRKTHSFISEPKWAKDGDLGLPVFDTLLGRIGIAICMDAAYPETTRIPALRGADVIAFPTNWLSEKAPSPSWWARAVESGVYLIAANRYGVERGVQFDGGSCIIEPDGAIHASIDTGDGVVLATVDVARARDKQPAGCPVNLLAARRPETYGTLTLNTHLWNPLDFHGLYGHRPLPAGRVSRGAVLQMEPQGGNAGANLAGIAAALAGNPGVDLLVTPEYSLSGRPGSVEQAAAWAEPVPGPGTEALSGIAAAAGAYVVAGLVERDGDRLFDTLVLAGPDGLVGMYRAVHLDDASAGWATAGDEFPVFDIPAGRVGMMTGTDALFPEAGRSLALAGADAIAVAAGLAWPGVRPWGATAIPMPPHIDAGATADHFHLLRERSRENNSYVLYANAPSAGGWSGLFSAGPEDVPRQDALVAGTGAGVAVGEIDTTNLPGSRYATNPARAKDLVRMRMPIWYDPLQAPKDSWLLSQESAWEPEWAVAEAE